MNFGAKNRYLDQAERVLQGAYGGRRQSETSFLQQLIRELGDGAPASMSPAGLFRAALNNGPSIRSARDLLEVLAVPSQRPERALRAGDWMLRAVPGTGDVGHVSVLASDDLLTQSMLASEGIAAESVQPGYYGLVIESGAFPHSRSRPFARRMLDSRGRVPPNTVFLRPNDFPSDAANATPEVALPVGQGGRGDIEASPSAIVPPALPSPPEAIDPASLDLRIDPADPRIDVLAKFALQRMIKRSDMAADAARLIRGINSGTLAGIFGENLRAAAKLAEKLGTVRWKLVPKGEDAALILDPEAPTVAPPTIIFRVKEEKPPGKRVWPLPAERMDPALQMASRTFDLFQRGELGLCAGSPSAIPVPNLVPSTFCRVLGRDLLVVVTEPGSEPSPLGPVVSGALVQVEGQIEGPSPSSMLTTKFTDETGQARFANLAPGTYQLTASKQGFEDAKTQVVLADDQQQRTQFVGQGSPIAAPGIPLTVPLQLAPSNFPGIEAFIAFDRSKKPLKFVGPNTKIRWEDVQFQWKNKGGFSKTKLFLIVRHKGTGDEFFNRQIRDYAAMPPQQKRPIVDNQTTDTDPLTPLASTPFGIVECELKMVNLSGQFVGKKTLQLTLANEIKVKITNPAGTPLGNLAVHLIEPAGVHDGKAVKTSSGGEIIVTDPEFGEWTLVSPPDLALVSKASADNPFPITAIDNLKKRKGKPDTSEHLTLKRNVTNELVARQMFFLICPQCGVTFRVVKDTPAGQTNMPCPNDSFELTSLEEEVELDPLSFTRPTIGQDLKRSGAKSRGTETLDTAHGSVTVHWDESRFLDFRARNYILGTPTATTIKIIGRDTWGAKAIKTVPKDPKATLRWEFHEAAAGDSPPYNSITAVPHSENRRLSTIFRWMTIHHTNDPAQNSVKTVRDLQDKHQDPPLFNPELPEERADIAYHFVIDADGTVYEGRPIGIEGSHTELFNAGNVGIVLAGEFNTDTPTAKALAALDKLVEILAVRFNIKSVWTHQERKKQSMGKHTDCPGDNLIPHVNDPLRKKSPGPPP